ncbi:MAG: hypothetical protein ACK4GN_02790 [Runella sp.]
MPLPTLFYVCINNGSDTRINKEIKSLSPHFDIVYLGIGQDDTQAFAKPFCKEWHLVRGHHKSVFTFLKYILKFWQLYFTRRFERVHVINEQLLLIFFPLLWLSRKRLTADIFDSIFLRTGNRWVQSLQKAVYRLPQRIIVTDDNRKTLVPPAFQSKIVVVENYPYTFDERLPKLSKDDELLILYSGSLGVTRGTALLEKMVVMSPKVTVWMVGWVYDEPTRQLSQHPQVKFWGVKSQQQTMQLASQCDYILSVYEPINQNNLNASPNKIYDAIQAHTPVIINAEIKVAQFVEEQNIGYVLPNYYVSDVSPLIEILTTQKKAFVFDESLSTRYTWEAVEHKLLQAHDR